LQSYVDAQLCYVCAQPTAHCHKSLKKKRIIFRINLNASNGDAFLVVLIYSMHVMLRLF